MRSEVIESNRELDEQIDRFNAFIRRARRFWLAVPIALLVGAAACAVFLLFVRKPTYKSEAVVLYSQRALPGEQLDTSGARNVPLRLRELLMSRSKLERVVKEFELYPDMRKKLGMIEAIEEFEKHIEFRAPGGDTFSIAFIGHSPQEAQRVTTRLAGLVIDQDAELRKSQARVARDFLTGEKSKTEAGLRAAERDLAAFMAEHPRFALDVTPLATGAAIRATTAQPVANAGDVSAHRVRQLGPGGTPALGLGAPNTFGPRRIEPDSDLGRATAAVAAARANLAEMNEKYTDAHPDVRAANSALQRAESRLSALEGTVGPDPLPQPAPAAPPAALSESRAPVVRREPNPQPRAASPPASQGRAASGDVVALETDWLKLTRAVTEARQRADQVEAASFKADIVASSEAGGRGLQMSVIDPAYLPAKPLPPGRTVIAAIFAAVSLLVGLLVACIRAVLDDRIFEARDAPGAVELLVQVPHAGRERRVHVPS